MYKRPARRKRAAKARGIIRNLGVDRLLVHKTPRHTYAQVTTADGARVLASASTVEPAVRQALDGTGNQTAAATVGRIIAERALASGVKRVAFDRSGFKYHGRIKALADAARDVGLLF